MEFSRIAKQINKNASILAGGLAWSALKGRFVGPKVLINSIPKSGTNLLQEFVNLLPLMRGKVTKVLSLDNGAEQLVKKLYRFSKGQSVHGHIAYHQAVDNAIQANGIKHLLIIRDFRDVILSNIRYLESHHVSHPHNVVFSKLKSMDEKIHTCLVGAPEGGIRAWPDLIRDYRGWLSSEKIHIVRFENLVSKNSIIAEGEIHKTLEFLELKIETDVSKIRTEMFNPKGLTFNSPGVNKWKTAFSQQQIKLLNEALAEELNFFEYPI